MQNTRLYIIIRLAAGVLTLVALLGHYYLPKKIYRMVPNTEVYGGLSSDAEAGGNSKASWIDEERLRSLCEIRLWETGWANCSMTLSWGTSAWLGKDLSRFDGFRVKLKYKGEAERIRFFMRNYNPDYSKLEDQNSAKYMAVWILARDLKEEIFIDLQEFKVADWWIQEYPLTRELQKADFGSVVVFGVDYLTLGDHIIELEKLEFVGDWLAVETLMLSIILIWMLLIFWEGFSRLYLLSSKEKKNTEIINELVGTYSRLEAQKQEFENLSRHDKLTGVLNRHGLHEEIEKVFSLQSEKTTCTLIVLDIDHFKRINDRRGHDVGDMVLEQLAGIFQRNIRLGDFVGRWGGEEFVLLFRGTNIYSGIAIAEKLREMISVHRFESEKGELRVTSSLGVAAVNNQDDFTSAFKRADEALYLAKNSGRNCVMSELDL